MFKKNIDFNKSFKPVAMVYAAVILVGIIVTCIFGVNLDINFKGGTVITYNYIVDEANEAVDLDVEAVRKTAEEKLGVSSTVTKGSAIAVEANTLTVSLVKNKSVDTEAMESLTKALQEAYPKNEIVLYTSTSVSPTLATTFFLKSLAAVLLTAALVVVYVGFRFRKIGGVTAALTAFVAVILDLLVSFFVCAIFGLKIDSNYIAVVLTILGYSLNDTIVVYDSVREYKSKIADKSLGELVNMSLNRVKVRNIVTTATTVLAVTTIIVVAEIYGLTSLRTFAIPMLFGLVSGCISSLFISTPLWVLWRNKLDNK